MFAFCACFVIVMMLYVLYQIKYRKRNEAFATFPTMKKRLLIHNSLEIAGLSLSAIMKKVEVWQRELGEVFLITTNPFDCGTIIVNDPVIAEAVSFHRPDRSNAILYKSTTRWIGKDGFFFAPPKLAAALQKPLWNALSPKNLEKVGKKYLSD
jgi:hypothetical protein